jgi:hypothetical protein
MGASPEDDLDFKYTMHHAYPSGMYIDSRGVHRETHPPSCCDFVDEAATQKTSAPLNVVSRHMPGQCNVPPRASAA